MQGPGKTIDHKEMVNFEKSKGSEIEITANFKILNEDDV